MAAYVYLKKSNQTRTFSQTLVLPSFFLGGGVFLLALVLWPILSFEMTMSPKLSNAIISPLVEERVLSAQTDFTQASNWFPSAPKNTLSSKITSYTLSIPKLGITDATVIIGGEDLAKSLIQWGKAGETASPGEFGNTVIFGHSVLPTFFDPKNYTTIFSTLPTLEIKDEIYVYYDGITYQYQVFDMKVVEPTDVSVLEQKYDDSYLSLITCVPPGTYWKRLVVKARLVKI